MIKGSRSNKSRISERTTKEYYVLMDGDNPVGVCPEKDALQCFYLYAESKDAVKIPDSHAFIYEDSSGYYRLITLQVVPRMKMAR